MVSANSVSGGGRNSLVKWGKFLVVAALVLSSGFFVPNAGATITSIVNVHPVSPAQVRGAFNITWTATGEPGDLVDIYYSTNDFTTWTKLTVSAVPYNADSYPWDSVAARVLDGTNYKVKVKSTTNDVNGISETAFTIDNTAPTTGLVVDPPNEFGWYTSVPTITLNCVDTGGSGCNKIFYKWDGAPSYTEVPGSTAVVVDLTEGEHTLYYHSSDNAVDKDGANNVETDKTASFKVDLTDPTISGYTLDGNPANAVFNPKPPISDSVAISITANEPVKFTRIYICANSVPTCNGSSDTKYFEDLSYKTSVTKPWDGKVDGTETFADDGLYKLSVNLKDRSGRTATVDLAPHKIVIDSVAPAISDFSSPVTDTVYTADPALTFTATDPAPGTEVSCTYRVDSGSPVSVPCTGIGRTVTGLSDGRHSVVVTATDQAGNATNSSPIISFVFNNDRTLTVCKTGTPDFTTISAAVTAATAGDTVSICAGTYNESVLVGKQLTLFGSGAKPVISGSAGTDHILKVNGANGVVLDNLEINGGSSNNFDYGILVNSSGTNLSPVEIRNSTVKNVWRNGAKGIGAESSSYVLAHNNTISSFHKSGIRFVASGGKFYDNEVVGDNVDGTSRVQNLVNMWTGSNVEVYGNHLHNALTTPGVTPTWDSTAVFVSSYYGGYPDSGSSQANIHNNEIYDSDSGIVVGSFYSATDNSTATITNNNFHNLNWAINFEKGTVSATITGNKFSTVNRAVSADDGNGGPATKPAVNAERNWWGTAYRPAIVRLVYPAVDFDPYWVNEAMTILSDTPVMTAYVDNDYTDGHADGHIYGYDAFAKIQEGIEKIQTGGSVNVAAGTYVEDVTINKPDVSVRAVTRYEAVVEGTIVISANGVTADGFSVRAFSQIPTPDWSGIYIPSGTGILVTNNLIDGTGIDPVANLTVGIHTLYGATAGATLEGNIIRNVRMGIYNQGASLVINRNTIEGTLHSAIGVDTALGTTITRNTIRNGGSLGIEVFGANVVVHLNKIVGNTNYGIQSFGPQVNASQNWWGSPTGPTHSSNPGGSGDVVSNNVTFSPWCTNEGCTEFGSSDPLHHFDIAASPNPATVPGPIILTITAKDAAGVTRVNDNGQITLTANKPVSFEPDYILNLVSGVKNADVSYPEAGNVNVHVTRGSVDSVKPITFSAVVIPPPTGVSVDDIVAQNTFATADGTYLHGWHYTFRITVNNPDETDLFMKFNNWVNTADEEQTVTASPNTHLLINTAGGIVAGVGLTDSDIENGFGTVKSYALGNNYSNQTLGGEPAAIDISDIDNSPGVPGRQVQFDVFVKLPESTAPGFYQTEYGIRSMPPAPR